MLETTGAHNYGTKKIVFYKCLKCKTEFPVLQGVISCNNMAIFDCPWCKTTSKPWQDGRGL